MKQMTVEELMIPLDEYATVSEEATLKEAILELERAQAEFGQEDKKQYLHRALLVYDPNHGHITGKLSQLDVLKALEPKYASMTASGPLGRIATSGLSTSYLLSMLKQNALFDQPIADICRKAAGLKVKDCMYIPVEGEFIRAQDHMSRAIHQLVMGSHHSLLVLKDDKITGILRLVDVFDKVCQEIKKI